MPQQIIKNFNTIEKCDLLSDFLSDARSHSFIKEETCEY